MSETPSVEQYSLRLDEAKGYSEIWELVKDTVKTALEEHRVGMMLILQTSYSISVE